MVMQGYVLVYW